MTSSDDRVRERRDRALLIGPAAWRELNARNVWLRVHSVFASAVNLEASGSGRLIALTGPPGRVYPHAIVLERAVDFRTLRLETGRFARFEHCTILVDGENVTLAADMSRAVLSPRRSLPRITRLKNAGRACASRLVALQRENRLDLSLDEMLDLRPFDVRSLIGLGDGLTPSGDDFVCGFMAAVRARSSDEILRGMSDAIEQKLACTGDVSASMLRWALLDYWPEPLFDMADAIAVDDEGEALRALDELCRLGHSSGAAIATGFLFGLTTLLQSGQALLAFARNPGFVSHQAQRRRTV